MGLKNTSKDRENTPKIIRVKNFINKHYEIRLDVVKNVLETRPKGSKEPFQKDEKFEANLIVKLLESGFEGITNIVKFILASNFVKEYHPVKEYFQALPEWDRFDRIQELTNCLDVSSDQKNDLYINFKRHLLRCVASVFVPGYFNKHCFVLVGTRQNMYKTSFIRYLCPAQLDKYRTDMVLDWKDKDASIALGSNWIINMDELANLNKEETNSLKATLSRDIIKVRRPYDRNESEIPRLANFFGSTNDLHFLTDLTGNVRWICFRVYNIDGKYNTIDINQVWAQAYTQFLDGVDYQLTRDELNKNEKRNTHFMISSPELDAINSTIIPGIKGTPVEGMGLPEFKTSTELKDHVSSLSGTILRSPRLFGQALQAAGFISVSERNKQSKEPVKGYWFHSINNEIE